MTVSRTSLAALTAIVCLAGGASRSESQGLNPFPKADAPDERNDTPQELANKRIVLEYYEAVNNAKDVAAASRLAVPGIRLHDPDIPDGTVGLQARIQTLKERYPQAHREVKRVLTSGDHVFLHSHAVQTPGTTGFIAGDFFRLENGKIVEQWSVLHPIPEKPHPDNHNGPF
jgi:predicted SnoaL-like aldol condensation-catalyzing enzyme